ncbi:MAG TPA: DNA/RNA non-specific endonuclease [Allosphingosinicella sp.]|nr:DNA/RNA non-specific endonuclease [Allosphingosinicella sp.]
MSHPISLFLFPLSGFILASAAPAAAQPAPAPAPVAEAPPAAESDCPSFHLQGRAPSAAAPARSDGRILCHSFYAISYSTALRNPLWTSYRLTRAMAEGGDRISRFKGKFRNDPALTTAEQGAHKDYVSPPFDRGHLTPANDAEDMEKQKDTFVITNVVPQIGEFNRGLWRFLEASVHELAKDEGEVFIVTGARFAASPPLMSSPSKPGRIAIPDATFKAIYIPSRNVAIGYLATNEKAAVCTVMSIADLRRATGVDPFPSLPASVTDTMPAGFTLPKGEGTDPPDCRPAANDN